MSSRLRFTMPLSLVLHLGLDVVDMMQLLSYQSLSHPPAMHVQSGGSIVTDGMLREKYMCGDVGPCPVVPGVVLEHAFVLGASLGLPIVQCN